MQIRIPSKRGLLPCLPVFLGSPSCRDRQNKSKGDQVCDRAHCYLTRVKNRRAPVPHTMLDASGRTKWRHLSSGRQFASCTGSTRSSAASQPLERSRTRLAHPSLLVLLNPYYSASGTGSPLVACMLDACESKTPERSLQVLTESQNTQLWKASVSTLHTRVGLFASFCRGVLPSHR